MAQRGIIQSRLRLDTKEFYTRLDAALKKAQQTANAMQKVFSKPLTLPTVPTASGGGRGGRTDPALAAQREAARQGLAAFRDLELAQRKNLITQAEFVRLSRDIERVLENERAQLERNTRGYAAYTDALRQINNGLNRGFNTQPAVRSVDDLSLALDRLQSAGDLLLAGGGLFALFRFINNSAKQSFNAATSLRLYREELERQGKSADEGVAILDRLGARFKINGEQIAGAALALTRYGLNASDIEEQLALVGASSVARTGNAAAGMNALADAYESGSSTALNFVGVAANLVTEFERYAATQNKVRDQLTRVQEGEAFTLALRREAGGQLASLNTLLEGYGGATSQAASESYSFGNAVGSAVTPALTTLFKTVASVLAVFNGLPKVLQSAIVVTGVLTTTLGLLAFAYKNIVDVLNPFQTASTVLTVLLKNEIVARTRLGAVLALLGTRYGLVTAAVAANTEVAVASAGSLTLLQAVMMGLTRALALVRVAFARLIANPVVAALAAIGVAFLLVKNNMDIFRPALEALKASFQPVLDVVGRVTKAFGGMFAEGTVLGNFLRNGLINVASLLALTLVGLSNAVGQVIIAFQFWGDLFSQGYDQALANFDRRSAELTERTKAAANAILDATEAGYGQVAAQNAMADSADNAAAATARLTEEQKKQRADFQGRAAEFELSFDQTGLEGDIASAQSSIQSFIDEVGEAADKLPLKSKLRREYREIELDLLKLRERIGGKVIADTLAEAQEDTASAVAASMQNGAAKIMAQRDLDLEAERRAFEERTNALVKGSDTYNEFLALYSAKTAAINTQANRDLEQLGQDRVETARELNRSIADAQAELATEQAANDPLKSLSNTFQQTIRQIERDSAELLRAAEEAYKDGTITYQEYQDKIVEITDLSTARQLQAQVDLTTGTNAELERRQKFVQDSADRVLDLQRQSKATTLREGGNEQGALRVELAGRMQEVKRWLDEQLSAEGLTDEQITAIKKEGEAKRVALRQDYNRKVKALGEEEVAAVRDIQGRIDDVRSANQAARLREAGNERAALRIERDGELQDVEAALREQLATEGLTQQQITLLHEEAQAKRAGIRAAYSREVKKLNKEDADAVKAILEEQNAAYRQTQISGMTDIPGAQAQFGEEAKERRKTFTQTLKDFDELGKKLEQRHKQELADFKGTEKERQAFIAQQAQETEAFGAKRVELVKKQNQTEALLARQHQQAINRQAKEGLKAYLDALEQHETQLASLQKEAREREETNLASLLEARRAAAEQQLANAQVEISQGRGTVALERQAEAFRKLLDVTQEQASVAQNAVEAARLRAEAETRVARAARDRGESTAEIIALEKQAADAQGRVVQTIESQIDALKRLRQEQLGVIGTGSDVLDYLKTAGELTGNVPKDAEVGRFLEEQQDRLTKVLEAQVRANAPVSERLETLKQISELEKDLEGRGRKGLDPSQRRFIDEDALRTGERFESDAAKALRAVADIDRQLGTLDGILTSARREFSALLEAAGEGLGLSFEVKVDTKELDEQMQAAQQMLLETFGPKMANLIVQQANDLGLNAGKGFTSSLAQNIRANKEPVIAAIRELMGDVDSFLPHSDAARGPLSRLSHSGRAIPLTLAQNMRRDLAPLRSAAGMVAAAARPGIFASAIPTSRPAHYPASAAAAGMGGTVIERMYIDGGKIQPSTQSEMSAGRLIQQIGREADLRRKGYK